MDEQRRKSLVIYKEESVYLILYFLFYVSLLVTSLYQYFAEFGSFLTLALSLLIIAAKIFRRQSIISNELIFLETMIIALTIINTIINGGGIGSVVNLISFTLGMIAFSDMSFSSGFLTINLAMNLIIWAFYTFIGSRNAYDNYLNGSSVLNSNTIGQIIMLTLIVSLLILKENEYLKTHKGALTIISILLSLIGIWGCNSAQARGSEIAIIIYFLLDNIPFLKIIINKISVLILGLIAISGAIFPYYYVWLYKNNITIDFAFSTKRFFSGRQRIWKPIIDTLSGSFEKLLFGVGSNGVTSAGVIENAHNWFLGTIFYFGIVVFILYFLFLILLVKNFKNANIVLLFVAIFINGFVETGAMYILSQMFVFLVVGIASTIKKNELMG